MNINALKALYVALGGNLANTYSDIADGIAVADYVLLADVISAIAKIAGGSIELPAVSSTDNGDLLSVVNGAWAKAKPLVPHLGGSGKYGYYIYWNGTDGYNSSNFLPSTNDVMEADAGFPLTYADGLIRADSKATIFMNITCEYDTATEAITSIVEDSAEFTPTEIATKYVNDFKHVIIFAKVILDDSGSTVGHQIVPINSNEDGFYFTVGSKTVSGGFSDTEWTVSA